MTSERNRQLDRMTELDKQEDILRRLQRKPGTTLRIDTRAALAFWEKALGVLEDAGKIEVEFVDSDYQQCSFYNVRLPRHPQRSPEDVVKAMRSIAGDLAARFNARYG